MHLGLDLRFMNFDVVLVDESRVGVHRKLELWRQTWESKGFRTKTKYLWCDFSSDRCKDIEVTQGGKLVPKKGTFRYLGSILHNNGGIDEDVRDTIKAGWMK